MKALCKLCEKRRAKRHCPGVAGDICPQCCGTAREETVDCPPDCTFLQEARRRQEPNALKAEDVPNADIQVDEKFLRQHEEVFIGLARALFEAMTTGNAVDADAREALEALIKTYRTAQSGLIYETRPPNAYAAALQNKVKAAVEALDQQLREARGMSVVKDSDVLTVLVFLQRMELQYSNGRRRGRAFLDFLGGLFVEEELAGPAESVAS